MGRPKLKDEVKKERISITLPRRYKQAVLDRGNASVFVEDTIRLYLQLEETVKRLAKQKNHLKVFWKNWKRLSIALMSIFTAMKIASLQKMRFLRYGIKDDDACRSEISSQS